MKGSMSEEKKIESRPGGLQREAEGSKVKAELRRKIESIRRGHATGGYCETEALQVEEKKLHKVLSEELEALKQLHGYSPDPKFKHPAIRAVEVELHGLSWKPTLVVKEEN
jgi:hypothetical protein